MPNIQRERERERVKRVKAGLIVLCLILLFFTVVEASPPGSAYTPGETLAPSCSPGDTNCKVALTSGSVLFSNGTDLITQDNSNFYWDDTNNRLGIGTTTPSYKLTILGDLFVNTSSTLGNVISGTWQGTAIGDSYISSAATWNAKITTSSLSVAYSPLSYNNVTGVFSLATSTASQSGFLSSTDWTTFNDKQAAISWPIAVASTSLTASLPLLLTTNDLSLTGRLLTIHNIATSTGSLIAGKADTTGWYGLTIGTDGKVLMASSTATYGMSWETVALTPAGSNTQIQFNNAGAFLGDANFTWASSTQLLIITGTSTISGNLGVGTTTPVSLFTVATTTNIFNVLSSGYVGIGTSTPGYKLTINSSNATDNLFQVATTTNQGIFVINSDGNVGIGTTTPAYKLDVAGQIRSSSGGFVFPDGSTQTMATTATTTSPSFSVHKNGTNQTGIVNSTWTLVTWSTEDWDTNSNFASNKFTPTVAGKYFLTAQVRWITAGGNYSLVAIYKNGGVFKVSDNYVSGGYTGADITIIVDANGSTDYFEAYVIQDSGGNRDINGTDVTYTYFQGHKLP